MEPTADSDAPTVLVVDDSPENLHVVGELLSPDYRVRVANSGRRALELLGQPPLPELVLLDIMMPEMDGREVLRRLKKMPDARDIPVIFLTAMDGSEAEEAGLALGAVDYLTKPAQPAILRARVKTHVDLYRTRRALQRHGDALEARVRERTRELAAAKAAAEQASAAKTAFLATMSHELRTPMSGIIGALDLLAGGGLDAEQAGLARMARDSAGALLHVLNDILEFAAADAGQLVAASAEFVLADLVAEMASFHGAPAREKGLALHFSIDPALPPVLLGDAARLRQILVRLIDNAIKFTEQGEVRVSVGLLRREGDGLDLCCEVRDSGPGIPAAVAAGLFQPFAQGEAILTRRHGGSGLGLATAARLVALLGGRIGHEPAPGGGALFRVELPLRIPV